MFAHAFPVSSSSTKPVRCSTPWMEPWLKVPTVYLGGVLTWNGQILSYTDTRARVFASKSNGHHIWRKMDILYWKNVCVCACSVAGWCLTLCSHMDCSQPGSSVHGTSQARILDWLAISFSRGSSQTQGSSQEVEEGTEGRYQTVNLLAKRVRSGRDQ